MSTNNTTPIATVTSVTGKAWLRSQDGKLRSVGQGEAVYQGEVLVTENGSRVELTGSNGAHKVISGNKSILLDASQFTVNKDGSAGEEREGATDYHAGDRSDLKEGVKKGGALLDDQHHGFIRVARIDETLGKKPYTFMSVKGDYKSSLSDRNGEYDAFTDGRATHDPRIVMGSEVEYVAREEFVREYRDYGDDGKKNTQPSIGNPDNLGLDEDDLNTKLSVGNDPDKEPVEVTGSLAVQPAGEPLDTTFVNPEQLPVLTSKGSPVLYEISPDGHTLTAYTEDGRTIFTVVINNPTDLGGSQTYTFTLTDQIDHEPGAGENDVPITIPFQARDYNGDTAKGLFTVTVNDIPEQNDEAVTGTVHEDALPTGNAEGGQTVSVTGSVSGLVSLGADEPATYSLNPDTTTLENLGLTSKGELLTYEVDGDTLTANGPDGAVFTLELDATTGEYEFTLLDQLDHQGGEDDGELLPIDLSSAIIVTDADNDVLELDGGSLVINVEDDIPEQNDEAVTGTVHEDALPTGNAEGGQTVSVTGSVSGLVSLGADEPATYSLNPDTTTLENLGLTSKGELLTYEVDGDTLTANGPDGAVFTLELDATTGEYEFTLLDQLDHQGGEDDGELLPIDLSSAIIVTDADNDVLELDGGSLVINVEDDIPEQNDEAVTGTVHEDALPTGNAEGGQTVSVTGSVSGLVSLGADEPATYSLNPDTTTLENLGLTSKGELLTYEVDGDTLTANGPDGAVFTLELDATTGEYEFTLLDQLDHQGGEDDGELLPIDLSSAIIVTDADNDVLELDGGSLVINVEDDIPEQNDEAVTGTVHEDALPTGNAEGGQTVSVTGSVSGLVSLGADEPATYSLNPDTTTLENLGLTSKGELLTYEVDGDTLTANGPDGAVFTLELDATTGEYEFTLLDQLDHQGGEDDGELLPIDLSSAIIVTDADNDVLELDGGSLVINVEDDIPEQNDEAVTGTVHEDALPTGNAEGGQTVSVTGSVSGLVSLGADEPATYSLNPDTTTLENLGLTSKGELLTYEVDGDTLTANGPDGAVFTLELDATTGEYEFTLLDQLDHQGGEDDGELLPIDLSSAIIVTDADNDVLELDGGSLVINVEDDIPEQNDEAVTGTVHEDALPTGNAEGGQTVSVTGSVSGLVSLGADEPATYSLNPDTTTLENLGLTSKGELLTYEVDGDTLTANGPDGAVFTLELDATTGEYEFTLLDQLDHQGGEDDGELLPIDLSSAIIVTDADNDVLELDGGSLVINVEDDIPEQNDEAVTGTVHEDALPTGNAEGGQTVSVTGSVSGLVSLGADEPATYSLNPDTTTLENLGLTSKGELLTYEVDGDTLTANGPDGAVFTLELDATTGEYEFTLLDQLDHQGGEDDGELLPIDLSSAIIVTDADNDVLELDGGSLVINVEDDIPEQNDEAVTGTVHEDALPTGNAEGGQTVSVTGSVSGLVSLGADEPATYSLNPDTTTLENLGLTSKGELLTYEVDGDTLTANGPDGAVFTLELDATTGEYEFTLLDQLDHQGGEDDGELLPIDLSSAIIVTDADNDVLELDGGSLVINVEDDIPEQNDEAVTGTVHEDALPTGNAEGGQTVSVTGSVSGLVSLGADEPATYSLNPDTTTLENLGLTSKGELLTYEVDGDTLTANGPDGAVFTLELDATTGEYEFTLLDQLDHQGGEDDGELLPIDLSSAIIVTDADNDVLELDGGSLVINVEDDIPEQNDEAVTGTVHEDALPTGNAEGGQTVSVTGSVSGLVSLGADEPATYSLNPDTTTLENLGLTSKGELLTYEVDGDTLTANGPDGAVFTLELDATTGEYEFTLLDQLDHQGGEDDGELLPIDLSSAIIVTDADNDVLELDGGSLVINVEDDIPEQNDEAVTGTVHEDALPTGNAEGGQTVSVTGSVSGLVSLGADEPATYSLNPDTTTLENLGLTSKGELLTYEVDGDTLTANGPDGAVFTLELDATTGEYEFTLLDQLDHQGGEDDGELLPIDLSSAIIVTDADNDVLELDGGSLVINVEDDIPEQNDEAVTGTVHEDALPTGNAEGGQTVSVTGSVSGLVSLGADEPATYSLNPDTTTLENLGLTSKGELLTYEVDGDTLTANGPDGAVFTLELDATTGEYEFTLLDQLDHQGGEDDGELLPIDLSSAIIVTDADNDVLELDGGSLVINVEDDIPEQNDEAVTGTVHEDALPTGNAEGGQTVSVTGSVSGLVSLGADEPATYSLNPDTTTLENLGLTSKGELLTYEVDGDTLTANGPDGAVFTLELDATTGEYEFTLLDQLDHQGGEDDGELLPIDLSSAIIVTDADNDVLELDGGSLVINVEDDIPEQNDEAVTGTVHEDALPTGNAEGGQTVSVTGSVSGLVSLGADEPATYSLNPDTTTLENLGLTSKGELLTYEVDGDTLTANGPDGAVFTLELDATTGEYEFTLLDQLDHQGGEDDGELLPIDLSSAIIVTDADNDVLELDGGSLVINVEDDIPEQNDEAVTGTVHEDALPTGNAEGGQTVSVTGSVSGLVSLGADEPATYSLNPDTTTLENLGLTSKGELLTYEVDGDTLTANGPDGAVFTLELDATTGEYEFTLLDQLDHQGGEDDGELLPIDLSSAIIVTDADNDVLELDGGSLVINVEDDIPEQNDEAVTGTVHEDALPTGNAEGGQTVSVTGSVSGLVSLGADEPATYSLNPDTTTLENLGLTSKGELLTYEVDGDTLTANGPDGAVFTLELDATTGEYEFTLLDQLDHQGGEDDGELLPIDLSSAIIVTDADNDVLELDGGSLVINVEDDIPEQNDEAVTGTVHEDALPTGNAEGGQTVSVTGSVSGLVSLGADEPATYSLNPDTTTLENLGLTSKGELLTYEVDGDTLTANGPDGAVFTLELDATTGEYEFTLLDQLDHQGGEDDGELLPIDLSSAIIVTDADNDVLELDGGSLVINVEDDIPEQNDEAVTGTVHEDALPTGNAEGGQTVSVTGSVSGLVSLGADEPATYSLNPDTTTLENLGLTSKGELLTYEVDGDTLTANGPDGAVFTLELDATTGEYEFTLLDQLDHQGGEDDGELLPIDLSSAIIVTDADNDVLELDGGSLVINVEDDIPEQNDEAVTGTVHEDALPTGNAEGGQTVSVTGSVSGLVSLGADEPATYSLNPDTTTLENLGLTSKGELLTYEVDGDTLTANGPDGAVFTLELDATTGEYEFTLLDQLDHQGGEDDGELLPIDLSSAIIVTDADNDVLELDGGSLVINVEDDIPEQNDEAVTGTVHEDALPTGNAEGGQTVSVTGSVSGLVSLGADEPATYSLNPDTTTLENLGLTSKGELLTYEVDGDTLTANGPDGAVFTLELDATTGEYEFTLLDQLDHQGGEDDGELLPIDLSSAIIVTDADNDVLELDGGSLVINVEDDIPEQNDEAVTGTVHEDALPTGNAEGGQTVSVTGSVSGLVSLGADEPATYSLNPDTTTLENLGLTSKGELLTYEVDGDTLTANGPDGAVFTLELDATTGEYEFTLLDQLDHQGGEDDGELLPIDLSSAIIVTDADNDVLELDGGSLVINVEDDIPEQNDEAVTGTVHEDALPTGNAEGGQTVSVTGSVSGLVSLGADEPATYSLNPDTTTLENLGLTSKGELLTYEVDGDTLTANGPDGAVFTLELDATTGEYEFTLLDQLDHQGGEDDGELLPIDLSSAIIVTDADNDVLELDGGSLVINVEDDIPEQNDEAVTGTVHEDALPTGNAEGGQTVSVTGSVSGLVSLGADEPATYSLNPDTTTLENLGLTSKGELLTYEVDGDTLTANGPDGAVFTLELDATTGEYEFTLLDQLDHQGGEDDGELLPIDLSSAIIVTDADNDVLELDGGSLVINVEVDDIPEQNDEAVTGTVHEDALPTGNAEGGQTVSVTGSVSGLVSLGADEPATYSLNPDTTTLENLGLTSKGELLTYEVDGDTLTANGPDGAVFTLELDATTGEYEFTLLDQLDHQGGEDDGELLPIDLSSAIIVTDADNDVLELDGGSLVINVEDDIPEQNDEAVTGTVHEDALPTGNAEGGQTVSVTGSVSGLVSLGADEPATYSLNPDTTTLENLGLTSKGESLTYEVSGDTLTANGPDGAVFTLELDATTGEYEFTLLDQLDHQGGEDDGELLPIDLSSAIIVTDADNDVLELDGGSLVISVENDIPEQNDEAVTGTVHEDALPTGNAEGGQTVSVTGSVSGLVSLGADEPATYSLNPDTTTLENLGLTSKGESLTYQVSGDTLTASGPDGAVFTLELDATTGEYEFTLLDQLDHQGGEDDGELLPIDLSSAIIVTDADNDELELDGGSLVISVENDIPEQNDEAMTGTVHEDALPTGNAEGGQTVSVTGSVAGLVSLGADEPAVYSLNPDTTTLENLGLTSKGESLTYEVSGDTLTASGPDGAVFTLELDATTGEYEFTLLDQLDHQGGEDDGELLPIDLSSAIIVTDADNDVLELDGGSLVISVENDIPVQNDEAMTGTVHEDALSTGNAEGGQTVSVTGSVAGLVSLGADEPAVYSLNPDTTTLENLGLTSKGELLTYQVSGDTLTASGPDGAVFTLELDATTGEYEFTLLDQLDHQAPMSGDLGDLQTLEIDLSGAIIVTDADNDELELDGGSLVINVEDDIPTSDGPPQIGYVEEESIDGDGNPDDDDLSGMNGDGDGVNTVWSGSVAGMMKSGADEPMGSYSLSSNMQGLLNQNLTSNGENLIYIKSGNTITAYADVNDDELVGSGEWQVFSFSFDSSGSYTFELFGKLDHEDTVADTENYLDIDFSSLIVATDYDGDIGSLGTGQLVMRVQDDKPEESNENVRGHVDEDELQEGSTIIGNIDSDPYGTVYSNSIIGLFSMGEDEPGYYFLDDNVSGLRNDLESNGEDVSYVVIDENHDGINETLVGYVDKGTAGYDTGDREVFTLAIDQINGNYTFCVLDQLDHPTPLGGDTGDAENIEIDFTSILRASDNDGDTASLTGTGRFVIEVEDDVPVSAGSLQIDVYEDGLTVYDPGDMNNDSIEGSVGNGSGEAVSVNGFLNTLFSMGADRPGQIVFTSAIDNDSVLTTTGGTVSSKGSLVRYSVSGTTLTGYADVDTDGTFNDGDRIVFTMVITNAATGAYTFTLHDQVDHPDTSGNDAEKLSLNLAPAITALDADGDPITRTNGFTVRIEDDVPINNAATVTGTVQEDRLTGGNIDDSVNDTVTASGFVTSLVTVGADESASFSVQASGLPVITSNGFTVSYTASSSTGGALNDTITATSADGRTIFTLRVNADGSYEFTLQDQIDHIGALTGGAGDDQLISLDLSGSIIARDRDGDPLVVNSNSFIISVEDDLPVAVADDGGNVAEGGNTITGTSVLGNDQPGADQPATITGFVFTNESGVTQTGSLGSEVDTIYGRFTMNTDGSWTYTSDASVDHSSAEPLPDVITYTVQDADDDISTAALTIDVDDVAPAVSPTSNSYEVPLQNTNLLITLDVSGSMSRNLNNDSHPTGNDPTRMDIAVESIAEMLSQYDYRGDVSVKLVIFSTNGQSLTTAEWVTVEEAKIMLNSLVANGGTNYDGAIEAADDAFVNTNGMIANADNIAYFISDGLPSLPTITAGDIGIQPAEQTIWETFLENNDVTSYAVGIGRMDVAAATSALAPIAYDANAAAGQKQIDPIIVSDPNDLKLALIDTLVVNPITGTLQGSFGPDGGYVRSIRVGSSTYVYSPAAGGSISPSSGAAAHTFDTTENTLTVTTQQGGTLLVDMDSGAYTYTAPKVILVGVDDVFYFAFADNDGDVSAEATATIELVPPGGADIVEEVNSADSYGINGTGNTLTGGAVDDFLVGGSGADTINGGDGNDILNGDGGYRSDPTVNPAYVRAANYADSISGGAGNDIIIYDGLDTVNGGDGIDTLILEKNINVDFSPNKNITNIEVIDLTYGPGSDTTYISYPGFGSDMPSFQTYPGNHQLLNLNADDVVSMTDSDNTLYILGTSSDRVDLNGFSSSGTESIDVYGNGETITFNHYEVGASGTHVYVQTGVAVV
ncbi:T1SS-143 repeat domain-containing protein [Chlorobium limicola]|nr:DUF5801 repeats-in-toxin domain-containing protein [Chlorobium limicola]